MARELVLLAGLHKTATTSIQATCVANVQRLRAAGWVYPLRLCGVDDHGNHGSLMLAFRQDPMKMGLSRQLDLTEDEATQRKVERARDIALRRLEQAPRDIRLMLAAESASTMGDGELRAMRQWFEQRGWRMRVVCHVRRLSSWLSSMVAQRVNGQMRMTIAAAVEEFRASGGIVRPRIERLRSVFPDLRVHSHEAAVRHRYGPPGYFLRSAGVPMDDRWLQVRANEGRGDCATRCLSLLNERFGLVRPAGGRNPDFIHTDNLGPVLALPGRKFALRQREAHPLLAMLHDENEWLRLEFGAEYFDAELAFDDAPCDWSPQAVAALGDALQNIPPEAAAWTWAQGDRLGLETGGLSGMMR
jgi:hypothetical protein